MADFSISYLYKLRDEFSGKIKNINRSLKGNKRLISSMNADLQRFSSDFKKFALVGVAAFGGITIAAAQFQSGMNNVLTLLDKPQIEQFQGNLKNASQGAIELGFSMKDSNKALFDSVSAIGDVDKSIAVFNQAQKLAVAGGTELGIATDGITSVMNAYGVSLEGTTDIANAFFTAQKKGKTTVALLSSNVGKIAPIAKSAGIGFKTLLATMAQLTLGGLSTEEASTALRGAISGLIKPTDEAKKVFKQFGIPVGASALQASDFTEVLLKLAKAAKKNPDLMAEMIPNIRALTAISALGTEQVGNLRGIIQKINTDIKDGTGLNDAFALKMEEVSRKAKQAAGSLKTVAISFGNELLPSVGKALDKLTGFLQVVKGLSPETKKIILVIGGFTTGLFVLLSGLATFVALKAPILGALVILSKAFAVLWLTASGPIGIIIAGLVALGFLGTALAKKYEPVRIVMEAIFGFLKKIVAFGNLVFRTLAPIGDILTGASITTEEQKARILKTGDKTTEDLIKGTASQRGFFNANINIKAPRGVVESSESKEKKSSFMNLGFNLVET